MLNILIHMKATREHSWHLKMKLDWPSWSSMDIEHTKITFVICHSYGLARSFLPGTIHPQSVSSFVYMFFTFWVTKGHEVFSMTAYDHFTFLWLLSKPEVRIHLGLLWSQGIGLGLRGLWFNSPSMPSGACSVQWGSSTLEHRASCTLRCATCNLELYTFMQHRPFPVMK